MIIVIKHTQRNISTKRIFAALLRKVVQELEPGWKELPLGSVGDNRKLTFPPADFSQVPSLHPEAQGSDAEHSVLVWFKT